MRAYIGLIDETGLRAFLPEDDSLRGVFRAGPRSACVWAAVAEENVWEIQSELRSGHRSRALGLLLNSAVELMPMRPAAGC